MRRFLFFPTFRSNGSLCIKCFTFTVFCVILVHIGNNVYRNSRPILKARAISDPNSLLNWHFELNKRMINELRKQIREKDKLLNYRGRVIFSLRAQVAHLNQTNYSLRDTLNNLTDVVIARKNNDTSGDLNSTRQPTPYPENIWEEVNRQARPCCIALKRMTDILRVYMETTDDLRDQLGAYQKFNFSQYFNEVAQKERLKYLSLNCSERFQYENQNLTKKQERLSNYQTYSNGNFYETFPPNRILPKQKFKNKGYHRNIDFSKAVIAAFEELSNLNKIDRKYMEMSDALLRYDELMGSEYKITFLYNKSRTFQVNLVKPFGKYLLSDPIFESINQHKELINIIVPISGRTDRLKSFLENIRKVLFYGENENIFLTVVIYGSDSYNIKALIKKFSKEIGFRNYDVLKRNEPFNRGRALHDGIMRWNGDENILFFLCDVDVTFDNSFLNRCRRYSELGKSVYIPILFSLYNPDIVFESSHLYTYEEAFNITEETGTWRPLGYGMVCVHKPDYLMAKGFNLRISGWGGEDVSLYQR